MAGFKSQMDIVNTVFAILISELIKRIPPNPILYFLAEEVQ